MTDLPAGMTPGHLARTLTGILTAPDNADGYRLWALTGQSQELLGWWDDDPYPQMIGRTLPASAHGGALGLRHRGRDVDLVIVERCGARHRLRSRQPGSGECDAAELPERTVDALARTIGLASRSGGTDPGQLLGRLWAHTLSSSAGSVEQTDPLVNIGAAVADSIAGWVDAEGADTLHGAPAAVLDVLAGRRDPQTLAEVGASLVETMGADAVIGLAASGVFGVELDPGTVDWFDPPMLLRHLAGALRQQHESLDLLLLAGRADTAAILLGRLRSRGWVEPPTGGG